MRALLALDSNRDLLDGSPSHCAVRGAQAGGECKHDDEKDGAQEDGGTDVGYGGVGSSEAVRNDREESGEGSGDEPGRHDGHLFGRYDAQDLPWRETQEPVLGEFAATVCGRGDEG